MRYYDFRRHWTKKIEPHLSDPEVSSVLIRDMNKFTIGRWGKEFLPGDTPHKWESSDWFMEARWSRFFEYVKHSACHYLVNFNLRLAEAVQPQRPWRIVSSDAHSMVWDGNETLFDMNFCALGISPHRAFTMASGGHNREQVGIGEEIQVWYAAPCFLEIPDGQFRERIEEGYKADLQALVAANKVTFGLTAGDSAS